MVKTGNIYYSTEWIITKRKNTNYIINKIFQHCYSENDHQRDHSCVWTQWWNLRYQLKNRKNFNCKKKQVAEDICHKAVFPNSFKKTSQHAAWQCLLVVSDVSKKGQLNTNCSMPTLQSTFAQFPPFLLPLSLPSLELRTELVSCGCRFKTRVANATLKN